MVEYRNFVIVRQGNTDTRLQGMALMVEFEFYLLRFERKHSRRYLPMLTFRKKVIGDHPARKKLVFSASFCKLQTLN
jgi:hypothetical protein